MHMYIYSDIYIYIPDVCLVNQTMMCIAIAHWFKADTVVWNKPLVHSAQVVGSHMPATVMRAWTPVRTAPCQTCGSARMDLIV